MNYEFHYYSTFFLAVKAGFDERDSEILAFSSQYVDHHVRPMAIRTKKGIVHSIATQNFAYWQDSVVRDIYLPFHFFPAGDEARSSVRKDGKTNVYDVRPNSSSVKELLVTALKSKDLYRIGIAFHTFADTWAHQNFTGKVESWNRTEEQSIVPTAGHAQVGSKPDLWLETWDDPRLTESKIVNKTRYLECSKKIYRYLCLFRGKDFHEDEEIVLEELERLVEAGRGRSSAEERMLEFLLWGNFRAYDKLSWQRDALDGFADDYDETKETNWDRLRAAAETLLEKTGLLNPLEATATADFASSHLGRWIEASKTHRLEAKRIVERTVGPGVYSADTSKGGPV